jgi:RNA polymerase sigma-70 factor (ECF subfamily)
MKPIERDDLLIADDDGHGGLEMLYRRYGAWLGAALVRRFGSVITPFAEDLVQETYVRIAPYQAAGAIRHPQALLMRIASNIARDHLRREQVSRRASPDFQGRPEQGADIHQEAEQVAALQLKELILSLPPKLRDVFVLSRFGGLTYEEIAHHCGVSVKTVEWRMTKALALCASRLQD